MLAFSHGWVWADAETTERTVLLSVLSGTCLLDRGPTPCTAAAAPSPTPRGADLSYIVGEFEGSSWSHG